MRWGGSWAREKTSAHFRVRNSFGEKTRRDITVDSGASSRCETNGEGTASNYDRTDRTKLNGKDLGQGTRSASSRHAYLIVFTQNWLVGCAATNARMICASSAV